MNDRELLEWAAKAYWGNEIDDVCSIRWLDKDECIGFTHGDNQDHNGCDIEWCWNPLTDDGDALRLANRLQLTIQIGRLDGAVVVTSNNDNRIYSSESWLLGQTSDAATRRAIVWASAEIGKTL